MKVVLVQQRNLVSNGQTHPTLIQERLVALMVMKVVVELVVQVPEQVTHLLKVNVMVGVETFQVKVMGDQVQDNLVNKMVQVVLLVQKVLLMLVVVATLTLEMTVAVAVVLAVLVVNLPMDKVELVAQDYKTL